MIPVVLPFQMGVSKNNGIPKSSILIGFSSINHPFWGIHIFSNHPNLPPAPSAFRNPQKKPTPTPHFLKTPHSTGLSIKSAADTRYKSILPTWGFSMASWAWIPFWRGSRDPKNPCEGLYYKPLELYIYSHLVHDRNIEKRNKQGFVQVLIDQWYFGGFAMCPPSTSQE